MKEIARSRLVETGNLSQDVVRQSEEVAARVEERVDKHLWQEELVSTTVSRGQSEARANLLTALADDLQVVPRDAKSLALESRSFGIAVLGAQVGEEVEGGGRRVLLLEI